ncbi:hypothetical protein DEEACLCL_00078 [Salmonella phage CRW-SP2]|nr:hypothetical protein DEEACLCL_00078 [Salmonella phage CRW-SP2]
MSETHIITGLVARLKNRMSREEVSEFNESHGDEIFINHEGTLAYVESTNVPSYEFHMCVGAPMDTEDFRAICIHEGVDIDDSVIHPFFVSWYDASDSPVYMMTAQNFVEATRLKN